MEEALFERNKKKRQTVKLLKNMSYPTYQVYGTIENTKINPDDAFKMAILETAYQLKGRFRGIDFPEELRIWALRLIEPDLEPEPGKEMQSRNPVPGRIFETNIGFTIYNGKVQCGFKPRVANCRGGSDIK